MRKGVAWRLAAAVAALVFGYGVVALIANIAPSGADEGGAVEVVPDVEDYRSLANSIAIAHSRLFYHSVCSDAEERRACEGALRFVRTARESYNCVIGAAEKPNPMVPVRLDSIEWKAESVEQELLNPNYWGELAADQDEFAGIEEGDTAMDLLRKGYDWGVMTRYATKDLQDNRMSVYEYYYLPAGMCDGDASAR